MPNLLSGTSTEKKNQIFKEMYLMPRSSKIPTDTVIKTKFTKINKKQGEIRYYEGQGKRNLVPQNYRYTNYRTYKI